MKKNLYARLVCICASILIIGCASLDQGSQPVKVKLIAINDFHGYLTPPPEFRLTVKDPESPAGAQVRAGGAAYLATLVKQLKAENPNSIVVGAGDFIGASPAISAFTQDEATVDIIGQIGLEVTSVGNHEFDRGKVELLRLQRGGCAPGKVVGKQTCVKDEIYPGAKFKWLAANVIDNDTGETLLPGTYIKQFGPVTVGFVGLTLQGTPKTTRGAGGLTFKNEAEVINEQAKKFKQQGVDAVVVLIHQGGATTAMALNDHTCPNLSGEITSIVDALNNDVDIVVSGHTHKEYVCNRNDKLLTQAGFYGSAVTDINLEIKPGVGVVSKTANSLPVINDQTKKVPNGYKVLAKDGLITAEVEYYDQVSEASRSTIQGYIAEDIYVVKDSSSVRINVAEHPMGDVIADAFLATTPKEVHADIAFVNPGGVRSNLVKDKDGSVTYDDLYRVAPFGNNLYYIDLTGEQLVRLLEQQWEQPNCQSKQYKKMCGRILQPSSTLTYTYKWNHDKQGKPTGQGNMIDRASVRVKGKPLDSTKLYRIVSNSFLVVDGGDNYTVFKQGKNASDLGVVDLQALQTYFSEYGKENPMKAPTPRIKCVGCFPIP